MVIYRVPGKQRKRYARTYGEARDLKATLTTDIRRGEHRELRTVTFEEYVNEWLDSDVRACVAWLFDPKADDDPELGVGTVRKHLVTLGTIFVRTLFGLQSPRNRAQFARFASTSVSDELTRETEHVETSQLAWQGSGRHTIRSRAGSHERVDPGPHEEESQ
jgi:hypothetical protein